MSSQYFRFTARAAEPLRSQPLERLIARADGCTAVADWRADAFKLIAPDEAMPAVASAVLCADRGAVNAAWVCLATPVHYVAEMNSVRMAENGMLSLTPAAAETLASDFNRVLGSDGIRMIATRSAQLIVIFDRSHAAATHDPREVRGQAIEPYLPAGSYSADLRRLMSEMEMWLFEHAINEARKRTRQAPISGLWFWGGGAALGSLPRVQGWTAGEDVYFNALGSTRSDTDGNAVIVVDAAPGNGSWPEAESRWLKPACEQLKARKLSELKISAADRCFTVSARGMQRFWRRTKPWQESFK